MILFPKRKKTSFLTKVKMGDPEKTRFLNLLTVSVNLAKSNMIGWNIRKCIMIYEALQYPPMQCTRYITNDANIGDYPAYCAKYPNAQNIQSFLANPQVAEGAGNSESLLLELNRISSVECRTCPRRR